MATLTLKDSVKVTPTGTVTTSRATRLIRYRALLGALKLEIKGLKRRGRPAYAIIKDEFGFKGTRQKVYDQFKAHIEAEEKECGL